MSKLTGVVVGCGAIGREHLKALSGLQNVSVDAVCDLSPAKAEATAERFGVKNWYASYQQLLADFRPDLIHIATPPASHFLIAKYCLSSKLNVLCEKPITVTYSDFVTLMKLAKANNSVLLENQNLRFHSSVKKIKHLVDSGNIGSVIDIQILVSLNISGPGSPYIDPNVPHFSSSLEGGIIGDFLPHIAYLTYMFAGTMIDLRTTWLKRLDNSPFAADEFRGFIKGAKAMAYVAFSGNAQPDGFWLRVTGTRMLAEANLFEPPRIVVRKFRNGEPAVTSLIDGLVESGDVLRGAVAGFWRKLGGASRYDGLADFITNVYAALEAGEPQLISLSEIDEVAKIVDRFTSPDVRL